MGEVGSTEKAEPRGEAECFSEEILALAESWEDQRSSDEILCDIEASRLDAGVTPPRAA